MIGGMTTDGVTVRAAQAADLPALTDIYNHYLDTTAITFDLEPYTVETRGEWLGHYHEAGRHRLLVATDETGKILGYISSSPYRPKLAYETSVEISIYCHPAATGRGVGTLLYQHLFDALRDEDVHRAYAAITVPNEASVGLHKKMGFTEVGVFREVGRKHGRYWDVLWLARPLP